MKTTSLKLVLVSTPIGYLGSGKGGGVELTMRSLIKGLLSLGHKITLLAPQGSVLPSDCSAAEIRHVPGIDQPSWQHQEVSAPVVIPPDGVLLGLWEQALELGKESDAVLNFSYDWLPIWLTPRVEPDLFHLISMGAVSQVMKTLISELSKSDPSRLAFHTYRQASDYELFGEPVVLGNGFDLNHYDFQPLGGGPLGWAGRVAPEKGLEDAVAVAAALGDRLLVWGVMEDPEYAKKIESNFPPGTIDWRGFLSTAELQSQLRTCRALLNTPKWNEAYGNVVVEAMACGVPVVAYDRGGPGELINSGFTGWLVPPDDVVAMTEAASQVGMIDRKECRNWVENSASHDGFARRVESWIKKGISTTKFPKG
ncbi:glycosyltransferase family 4 protein [Prochlorococcus sp. MIT 1307]|uniref:glycosyltransferase family 4 protein n=1 Tax=Prochlorococcus sp. MIT 1307 TaxID=3096219 RepID=UPI002A756122|nr:glycosyltransferase family 4 protein [Prochlorococcus sp. MIT 1307]